MTAIELEYAQHQQEAAEALGRLQEGDSFLAAFMESIDAPAQPTAQHGISTP